ncbi:MAG: NosD domain-containing protein [bacterium]
MEVSNDSDRNKFEKNVCNRNGQDGIFHYSSSNNTFGPGNTANSNEYGIRFDGSNIKVIKNDFHCNTLGDILDAGTGSTVIKNSTGPLPGCL